MNKFEELLQKYNKTVEEIDFSVENLTDEELEAKFAEVFGESTSTKEDDGEVIVEDESKEDSSEDETDDDSTEAIEENMGCKKKKKKCSVDENGDMNLVYEISHDDIRFALYNLLIPLEEIDNDYYFIWNVYDNYFIYENWDNTKCYKQEYTVDSDVVAFSGERIEMFKELLTASEKAALEDMRSNYSALVEFKATTEANELQAKKDAVFAQAEYDAVRETKSFKKLIESAKELTVEECEIKAKDILDDFATYAQNFSAQDSQKPTKTLSFNFDVPEKKKSAYGNLFN